MSQKGGYQIIDFSGEEYYREGIHNIIKTCKKAVLCSGVEFYDDFGNKIILSDFFAIFTPNKDGTLLAENNVCEIIVYDDDTYEFTLRDYRRYYSTPYSYLRCVDAGAFSMTFETIPYDITNFIEKDFINYAQNFILTITFMTSDGSFQIPFYVSRIPSDGDDLNVYYDMAYALFPLNDINYKITSFRTEDNQFKFYLEEV